MSPPASFAVAPSVPSRNNGSSSRSSSSSNSCVGYSLVRMCLAWVGILPTALTSLTGTNCFKIRTGSVGQMSLCLLGGLLALSLVPCHRGANQWCTLALIFFLKSYIRSGTEDGHV